MITGKGNCGTRRAFLLASALLFGMVAPLPPKAGSQEDQLREDSKKLSFAERLPGDLRNDQVARQIVRFLDAGGSLERVLEVVASKTPRVPLRQYFFGRVFKALKERRHLQLAQSWGDAWLASFPEDKSTVLSNLGALLLESGDSERAAGWLGEVLAQIESQPDRIAVSLEASFFNELGHSFERPQVLQRDTPAYTEEAIRARVQGTVLVSAVVEKNGSLSQMEVVRPLGFGLDEQALDSLARWRFQPAQLDGRPIRHFAVIEITFNLG